MSGTEQATVPEWLASRVRYLPAWTVVLPNMLLRGLTLISRFVLTVILALLLQPEEMGVYGLLVSTLAISTFVLGLEYYWFTMRELAAGTDSARARLLRDQLVLHVVLYATALPLLALAFSTVLPPPAFRWFLMLVVMEHLSQEIARSLIALGRPLTANLVLFVRSGAWVYPAVWLLRQQPDRRNLSTIVAFWFVGLVTSFALAVFQLRALPWATAFASPIEPATMRRGVRSAAPFIIMTGSVMTVLFLDRFIIKAFHGLGPVGVYTFFAGIAAAVHQLVNTSLTLTRLPELVRAHDSNDGRFRREVKKLAREVALWSLLLAGAATVCIRPVLHFVGREVYQGAIPVFLLLLVGAVTRCVADVSLYALYAQRRDGVLMTANIAAAVTSVVLNLLLVPAFSLVGAGISAVAASMVMFAVSLTALSVGQSVSTDASVVNAPAHSSN